MLAPLQNHFISESSPIALQDTNETADLEVLRVEKEPAVFNSSARNSSTSFAFGENGET